MSKHTKRKIHASKVRKHYKTAKQWGGVIPDIKLHEITEGLSLLKQSLSNFGMPDKRHPSLEDIRKQEQKDIAALQKIYSEAYDHEQSAIRKILAESIYNNGKKGDFKYSEDEIEDLNLLPQFAKSFEYKAFVDELCFPKTKLSQSHAASASNKSFGHKPRKTGSEEELERRQQEAEENRERQRGYSEATQKLKIQVAAKAAAEKKKEEEFKRKLGII
jgi:hypothetical protein